MASITVRKMAVTGGEREVYLAPTWSLVNLHLESNALGDNKMGYGPIRTEFMPGESRTIMLAPNTRLTVETTSSTPVEWGLHITELEFIDDIVSVLCSMGQS